MVYMKTRCPGTTSSSNTRAVRGWPTEAREREKHMSTNHLMSRWEGTRSISHPHLWHRMLSMGLCKAQMRTWAAFLMEPQRGVQLRCGRLAQLLDSLPLR
ncbi:hypothetical protein E2C01_012445 [Portunus trituberculatus]|uniref:Uncharacterized protein n=1 Tax=Portunus trituberculatus TaxID=210409 RepID=A0A5B7DDW3_PORTR|nr:hypothetical protein [Portunus trituberculatus]